MQEKTAGFFIDRQQRLPAGNAESFSPGQALKKQ
jgi:hypothetical protein